MRAHFDVNKTKGRWYGILSALGMTAKQLNGKNGPCPFCAGTDRWRWTDYEQLGMGICTQCGPRNGMQIVQEWENVDFVGAIKIVEGLLGVVAESPKKVVVDPRAKLNALWSRAVKLTPGDPVTMYLIERRLEIAASEWATFPPREVRYAASVPYYEDGVVQGRYDAMIACVRDGDGKPTTLHVTYLKDGAKAPVGSPRKVLSALGEGAAIRLWQVDRECLAVTEGIETALAVREHHRIPVWAAISAGGMTNLIVPTGVHTVHIYGDNDASFTGQLAAYALAKRLRSEGREVEVHIPNAVDTDWADTGSWGIVG